jgi:hypothetical protein
LYELKRGFTVEMHSQTQGDNDSAQMERKIERVELRGREEGGRGESLLIGHAGGGG